MASVLIVASHAQTQWRLGRILNGDGYEILECNETGDALRSLFEHRPDVALIEVPDDSSSEALRLIELFRQICTIPVLGVSPGSGSTEVVVQALAAGADNVVNATCSATELSARVRSLTRQYEGLGERAEDARQVQTGDLVIDRDARGVTRGGAPIHLTRTEYRLLDALAANVGRTIAHRDLLVEIWGAQYVDDVHYLRLYVGYLRKKLEDDSSNPQFIISEWGVGYRLAKLPIAVSNEDLAKPHRVATLVR